MVDEIADASHRNGVVVRALEDCIERRLRSSPLVPPNSAKCPFAVGFRRNAGRGCVFGERLQSLHCSPRTSTWSDQARTQITVLPLCAVTRPETLAPLAELGTVLTGRDTRRSGPR